jgi:hypothetical protein
MLIKGHGPDFKLERKKIIFFQKNIDSSLSIILYYSFYHFSLLLSQNMYFKHVCLIAFDDMWTTI